jgi:penicillin-insensitive murein endopeptidase
MRPERNRHFGHPRLIAFIRKLAAAASAKKLGLIGIGDLSQPRGGPAPSGHASHQTGLDVDIWYAVGGRKRQIRMVDHTGGRPTAAWTRRQGKLLELAARDPRVDRVFVHPVLKQSLCRRARGDRSWLQRIRPWWGHDEHFHVRLACPANSRDCVPQTAIPEGDGCAELSSWLAPQAAAAQAETQRSYQSRVGARPEMPEPCRSLVP